MQGSFKSKKHFAIVIATISALSIFYSLFISKDKLILKKQILITDQKPVLKSAKPAKGGRYYWVEFHFIDHYDTPYELPGVGLKYSLYHDLMNDIQAYDTLHIKSDKDHSIYSIIFKGKSYIDETKVLKWKEDNHRFLIFCRIIICLACLPILFFKKQPTFWHSGFEFEFRFIFLFMAMLAIAICIYFYYYGTEYLSGVDPATFR